MPRPVADDGHDIWGDLVKNYVEFKHCTYIKINSIINYLLETSWLHLDCSIRIFDSPIRVFLCISELVPINAYSRCMHMKSAQTKAWAAWAFPPALYQSFNFCTLNVDSNNFT